MAKGKQIKGTPVVLVGIGPELLDQLSNAAMTGMQFILQNVALSDLLGGAFGAEPTPRPRRARARAR